MCDSMNKLILCPKLVLVVLVLLNHANQGICQLDLKEYMKMPPMYHTDDYESCLFSTDELNIFCVVHAIIKPDNSSSVYNQVIEFSSDTKKHFAHDLLYIGHCLNKCEKDLEKLSEEEREDLYDEPFPWRLDRKWYETRNVYENTSLYRKLYDRKLNQCSNLWLRQNYNLSLQSTIEFCSTNQEINNQKYDYWHFMFLAVTFLILTVVSSGTYLDGKLNKSDSLNHYKYEINTKLTNAQEYLICFSIVRNWYRLTGQPKTEIGKDLRCLNAFRYITVLIFIMAHLLFGYSQAALLNPYFIEETYHNFSTITLNNTNTVQTFFFISGFLLYITIKPMFRKNQFNFKYFCVGVIYRYVRLTPPIAFLVLYNASFMADSGHGPFWKYFGEAEKTFCRKSWWVNLLYINNIVSTDRLCMGHLWYVAADTQLFIFTLFLCMIMFKFWKYRKQIFCATFIMSLVVHFTAHYVYGHDGIFLFTPEKRRSVVYDIDKALQQDYFPPYINTGNYLLGVLGAMLYFHSKKSKFNLGNSNLFIVIWYLTPSIGQIFLGITGFIFYKYYFDLPSIWVSLTAVFVQNIWGLFGIILVLGFSAKFKSPAKNFCNWPVFSPLSRLTYGIYLCHLSIVRPLLGQQKTLPYVSFSSLLVEMLALTVLCHIVALILCLLLEFPLTAIAKRVLRKNQDPLIELKIVKNHTDNNLNHITSHDQGDTLLPCKRNTDI